jgi:hypothetical protein
VQVGAKKKRHISNAASSAPSHFCAPGGLAPSAFVLLFLGDDLHNLFFALLEAKRSGYYTLR